MNPTSAGIGLDDVDPAIYEVQTHAPGPEGRLPLDPPMLLDGPCGDIFGWIEDASQGWEPSELRRKEFLIFSTMGGMRAPDGSPTALAYHGGQFELGMLVEAAAQEFRRLGAMPFAEYVGDMCDGRTMGTPGMMDSLPYRNDAAIVMRRLIRSLPTRAGIMGISSCDKGLPAVMMALAKEGRTPGIAIPGGVTLMPPTGEDAGKVQSLGARYAHGMITLDQAAEDGCKACPSAGGACQFLGTAATSQVVCESLGLSLPHSALAPSGQPIWLDLARRSARALMALEAAGVTTSQIVTDDAIYNAMVAHAAFGGSTNLLLHLTAIAHAAGLRRPTAADWAEVNRRVPRLVDVLPNGPTGYGTVQVYLAGGVPEVMLHLRDLGLLRLCARTVSGRSLGEQLTEWERSERRQRVRTRLLEVDGVHPDDVIMSAARARSRGLTSTVTFLTGNIAPEGSVVKSTAIDPSVIEPDGVFRRTGPARVFTSERAAIAAIKAQGDEAVRPGDILVVMGRGPLGCGMEETYQLTSALKHLPWGKEVGLITDARFSGVSTGACIGHVGPEALAGGPISRVREGDVIRIEVDCVNLAGSIDVIGCDGQTFSPEEGARLLASRPPHPDLAPDPLLPDDTRLWAALQHASGGTWGGCVYDVDAILELLEAGRKALGR